MFNDKKKKILLIVGLILVIIIVGVSLDSCSNSMKEDQITHKTIKQKSKSQSTLKAKNEKKDEQEVKQEEKKEETAKANSSSQSNTSESKKDNTASTSSNSNKNNSSSSSSKLSSKPSNGSSNNSGSSKPSNNSGSSSNNSKPAEHTHNWMAVTETRTVVDQAAYDEQIPVTEMKEHEICNQCGADLTGLDIDAHFKNSYFNGGNCGGFHSEWREEVTGYQTVHHDAVTHTETETTGYRCSICGATK